MSAEHLDALALSVRVALRATRHWLIAAPVLVATHGVCAAPPPTTPPSLTVFAASDLGFAFQELVPRFEKATGAKVTLVLGSSGNFAHQIEQGAPADVFFSADEGFVDRLVARGLLIAETRALSGQGRIVLATARVAGEKLTALRQLLHARVRRVAIANPLHAPYGRAAEEALGRTGVWDALRPKLVYAENIRQALQLVQTGAVEAGIVALSIAASPRSSGCRSTRPCTGRSIRPSAWSAAVPALSWAWPLCNSSMAPRDGRS